MFKNRVIETIKCSWGSQRNGEDFQRIAIKIQKQKRLSRQEFFKVYDTLRKEGPVTRYQNPDGWNRYMKETSNIPNP